MNENMIYILIGFIAYIAYKKYMQHKVLKLVPDLLKEGAQIVDVRTKGEFTSSHKDGSINIPLDSLKSRVSELDNTKPVIVCCASGGRSAVAKRMLLSNGFENVYNVGTYRGLNKF